MAILLIVVSRLCVGAESRFDASTVNYRALKGHEIYEFCKLLGIPGGIESSARNPYMAKAKPKEFLALTQVKPRAILDEIARQHPGYKWEFEGEVVNFRARAEKDKVAQENPLERRIKRLSIKKRSSFRAMEEVLWAAGIVFGTAGVGNPRYARISLEIDDMTERDALNAIARLDGMIVWHFSGIGDPKRYALSVSSFRFRGGHSYHE